MFAYVAGGGSVNEKLFHIVDGDAISSNASIIGDLKQIVDFMLPQNWGKK